MDPSRRRQPPGVPSRFFTGPCLPKARPRSRIELSHWLRSVAIAGSLCLSVASAVASPTYVGRVGQAMGAPLVPVSSVTLTASRAVTAGDAVVITVKLSTSLLGGVSASDAAGNTYYIDINLSDGLGLGRTIMLSALNVRALGSGASIKVNFPLSGKYLVSVDEFSGLSGRDVISSATGSGSTFSSGNTPTTSQPVDLLFGVVGIESGAAPGWATGWTALPTLSIGGDNLGSAYEVTTSAGQYAATGSTGGTWMAGIVAFKAVTPPDNPPVARLSVSQLSSPALTVRADGSASTDGDATPIASYRFDFGDGSAPVTTTAPTATAQHTYAAAGTYTVTLVVTDTGGHASSPATASITVTGPTGASVAVYAGYYDTHHVYNLKPRPDPWRGSSNVVFVGNPDGGTTDGWDTSALRVDNLSSSSITVGVTVDIGSHHYALWSPQTVLAGWSLIVAQTGLENFDGSDTNPAGCYGCDPNLCTTEVSHTIPVVNLTVNGTTTTYTDNQQVLNTGGVDASGCPWTGTRNDESHAWQQIYAGQPATQQWAAAAPAFETHGTMGQPVPNPTHGVLSIRFTNRTPGPVKLGVYDVAGRLVVPCVDGVLDAADYNMAMNLAGRPPGLYILALTTSEGTTRRRFTYVR